MNISLWVLSDFLLFLEHFCEGNMNLDYIFWKKHVFSSILDGMLKGISKKTFFSIKYWTFWNTFAKEIWTYVIFFEKKNIFSFILEGKSIKWKIKSYFVLGRKRVGKINEKHWKPLFCDFIIFSHSGATQVRQRAT